MARLCERPGCSDPGVIAYGFDSAAALVWLAMPEPHEDRHRAGVLCVRHADAMVVPIGWTLDDRRDHAPRLFHVPPTAEPPGGDAGTTGGPAAQRQRRTSGRTRRSAHGPHPDQLALPDDTIPLTGGVDTDGASDSREPPTVAELTGSTAATDDPDATIAIPWQPQFDDADDLGGVLDADSPLLARAFRGPGHGDGSQRRR